MLAVLTLLQDVLGHPNTKAFVSHCGVHSINEAAYHGVPVVAVPIQFEQVHSGCAATQLCPVSRRLCTPACLPAGDACLHVQHHRLAKGCT